MRRLILAAVAASTPAAAGAYCFKPTEPYCLRAFGTFSDDFSYRSCLSQMDSYRMETETFIQCQANQMADHERAIRTAQDAIDEAQREASQAATEFGDAVTHWNCRSDDRPIC